MTKPQYKWRSDWGHFIRSVAADFAKGISANEVTSKYCNIAVEWVGRVSRVDLGEEPRLTLDMQPIIIEMDDGRHGTVNYLNLVVAHDDIDSWRAVKPGQNIRFRTSVRTGFGPFSGLNWADLGQNEGYVSIGTNPSVLLEVIE
jgi:hypothetical protein